MRRPNGMKTKKYTKKELAKFKELLLKNKEKLLRQIQSVEKDVLGGSQRDASGDLSGYTLHMADVATDSYDREFSLSMATNEQKQIYEIDEALKRIEVGEYGTCMQCSKQIPKRRLKVVPHAKCCIECQSSQEKNPGKQ